MFIKFIFVKKIIQKTEEQTSHLICSSVVLGWFGLSVRKLEEEMGEKRKEKKATS